MITKLFEIRYRATLIQALATKTGAYAAKGVGGASPSVPYIWLCQIFCGRAEGYDDPTSWSGLTMITAHKHIIENWEKLEDGDVIDVEYILGETKVRKVSQRVSDQPK